MATIDDAITSKLLEVYQLPEWERRLPNRQLWIACEFFEWVDNDDKLHVVPLGKGQRSLFEHVEQLFCDLRCSERPAAGELRRLRPNSKGIWKLHPPGLRLYGWSPEPNAFVVVTGAYEEDTKLNPKLNDQKREYTLSFIKQLGLQHKVVLGDINAIFPPSR